MSSSSNDPIVITAPDGSPVAFAPPEPLSPAQVRTRRAEQLARIRVSQVAGYLPSPAPAPRPAGAQTATKRMTLEEVTAQRVPVIVSPEAHRAIISSSSEGRLFPQALSEAFGKANAEHGGAVIRIEIDAVPKSEHFALGAGEIDAETGAEPLLLIIHAIHADEALNPKTCGIDRWLVNADDLSSLHPMTRSVIYRARLHADELVRLYPHKHRPAPVLQAEAPSRKSTNPRRRASRPTDEVRRQGRQRARSE